ncbi:MAG: LON peptidase substrate-binding domain-containing protein, partial [Pseudomonadota bacterium]|nr:LON peptidase substrate-binding domain-containing protein [Pseudomonadota bacterium]
RSGGEAVRSPEGVSLHEVGTLAELLEVDSAEANVLDVRCRGTRRFELGASRQQADGLWLGDATGLADDAVVVPSAGSSAIVASLAEAIKALAGRGERPFLEPHHFDCAGWVANRWCEILPLPKDSKQRLMAIRDPQARLDAVDALMRSRHVSH